MKVTNWETAAFCRSLCLLLHAGIGLADSIHLLAQEETGAMQTLLLRLGKALDGGSSLGDAMEEAACFPGYAGAMIGIGETTGTLEETLENLAAYYDQRHRTARQIKNAVTYPGLLLLLMLGVIGVLLVKVLPVFDSVYASLGGGLSGLSAGLLHLGQLLRALLPVLLGILAVLAAAALVLALSPALRERVLTGLRVRFGDRGILRSFSNARFARALAMGMGSGLPLEESLDLARKLLADIPAAERRCEACTEAIRSGMDLTEALEKEKLLPPARSRMLAAGIRGGSADRIMTDIADRMMEEAEENLNTLVSRIEPAMVLIASLLVGSILLSVMLPLLDIMSTIG